MRTRSEALFETFLTSNGLPFERIAEADTRRPDYRVTVGRGEIIFEVKQLSEDENFGVVSSRTTGDHIRQKIRESKRQIQFGAKQGIPSVLLIYNDLDPIQLFGTERMDFIAAMYGTYTIVLDPESNRVSDWYNGQGRMLQENVNTSFSAIGHLCDRGGQTTLTLYENVFTKVKIPFDHLPKCFEVERIKLQDSSPEG